MKRSKREENGIIIHFMFYFILVVSLIIFTFSYLIPHIKLIENNKNITKDLYENIERIKHSGLSFVEFRELNKGSKDNILVTEMLSNIDKKFYDKNLINSSGLYVSFLKNKNKELDNPENILLAEEKNKQIMKILPSYAEGAIDFGTGALTDYKFINYIESIIETFNLKTTNSIGISRVTLLKEFAIQKNEKNSTDSNIFYIPLSLNLEGTKEEILNFIYFIENVGNVSIVDNNIYLNTDFGFLSKNNVKKYLKGDKFSVDYNIFEHQIIDINTISMSEYIDGSYIPRETTDFKSYIKKTQGNDDFQITVDLMFYVKGLPLYKIREEVNVLLDKYNKTIDLVNKSLKNTDNKSIEGIKLKEFNSTLKALKGQTDSIKASLAKKEKLEYIYSKTLDLDFIIDPIFNSLQK